MQKNSPFIAAIAATVILLGLYFSVLTIVSGWGFTIEQFGAFWPYILPLSFGFGIQVGLFTHLRNLSLRHHHAKHVLATSGATSTAAMLACCTHYLANVLPILGAVGVVTLAAEYQVELFGIGLAFNVAGIVYIGRQVWLATRAYKESPACCRTVFAFGAAAVVALIGTSGALSETKLEPRASNENGLLVVVTPRHVGPNDRIWEFDASMDTHVRPLNEDIAKNSSLVDSSGQRFKAIKWEGTGPGGHHRKGALQFLRPDPLPATVTLEIEGLGGSAKRSFSWNLK